MQNMSKIYKGYNRKITSTPCNQLTLCNCQVKEECLMDGKFQIMNVVYDFRATSPKPQNIYFGLAEGKWKKKYYNHKGHSTTNDIHMRRHFQAMFGI